MARVTRLELAMFRSWRRLRLAPGPGINALFGPNGAGKTNILEALSLLVPGRGLRGAPLAELARQPEDTGWRVRAELAAGECVHHLQLEGREGAARMRIDDKPASRVAAGRLVGMLWLTPQHDRLWTGPAEERRRFLDRLALAFSPAHARAAADFERAMRERNRLLREEIDDPRWFAALEARMAAAGAQLDRGRRQTLDALQAAPPPATDTFPEAELILTDAAGPPTHAWTEEALATALAEGRRRDIAAGRTLAGPHRTDLVAHYRARGVRASQASTGEQKALLVSVVLAATRALAARGAAPVLLLDEVAAHLDPARRAALYAELAATGAQAWLTGTDAALFAALPEGAHRFEVVEEAGASALGQVT